MKNILFVGLGSIGQRHLRNLKKVSKRFCFFAIRKKRNSPLLNTKNKLVKKKFISNENDIKEINYKELKKYKIDTVFITNPSSKHLNTAIKFAKCGCNLFIEKPLSHNLQNLMQLKNIIIKKKIKCAVGFQTRYDDLFKKIKKIIDINKYGNIVSAHIENRHFLPYHHKYEDYKLGYAARKELGGGVILCFIHEIDYANSLFGEVNKISGDVSKKSSLKINVEDYANFKIIYNKESIKFPVYFNLDFIKKKASRFCKIKFEKATLYWDLLLNKLVVKGKKQFILKSKFRSRNELFLFQLKQIEKAFTGNKQPLSNFENGEKSLKVAMKIKKLQKS